MKHWTKACLSLALLGACSALPASAEPPTPKQQAQHKQNKADLAADTESNREVIQLLERAKKTLQAQRSKDTGGKRAAAVIHIQQAMAEIRSQTSKPGH